MGYCFTLHSFAKLYASNYGQAKFNVYSSPHPDISVSDIDPSVLAPRLWGDIYFNKAANKFTRKAQDPSNPRAFVQFVLEPLYKLYSSVLSKEPSDLQATLATLGIKLKPVMYKMDVRPLLKAVLDQFFGPSTGLVDMIVEHVPSPAAGAAPKVRQLQTTLHYFLTMPLDRKNLHGSYDLCYCGQPQKVRSEGSYNRPYYEAL